MSIVARKTDRFAYVLFNRAHAVIDQQTQKVEARLDTREEAEAHRDALNAWWSRRPVPGMSFAGSPVFGTLWAETPEVAALLEMLDRLDDPERRLDVLASSLERAAA